eukprot:SM000138S00053  [mRNA]  locus=s138:265309:267479:- [translate_table: standard]
MLAFILMTASLTSAMWVWQIRSGDFEDMPLTRQAQKDLWIQQHPAKCSDPSVQFGIIDWVPNVGHGMGSQLHSVSGVLSEVLKSGRVAVLSDKWARAMHDGCQGDHKGRLDCYFFPSAAEECSRIALEYFDKMMSGKVKLDKSSREAVLSQPASSERFMTVRQEKWPWFYSDGETIAMRRQDPWAETPESIVLNGQPVHWQNSSKYRSWWRAQSIRTYVALSTAFGRTATGSMWRTRCWPQGGPQMPTKSKVPGLVGNRSADEGLAGTLWAEEEAFIPRPIASIHIRQGDKGKEMKLVSFHSFLWAAERVRYHVHTAWLSIEQQQVIAETQRFGRWRILYTTCRGKVSSIMMYFETMGGLALMKGQPFANLLIASKCDYFVGVLGSNWNRLINDLRLTNGRQLNGYIAT